MFLLKKLESLGKQVGCVVHPSPLTPHHSKITHCSLSLLTPHPSPLTPHPSLLTTLLLLTPQSQSPPLTPHPSPLTSHPHLICDSPHLLSSHLSVFSPITLHPSPLTPLPSPLTPHPHWRCDSPHHISIISPLDWCSHPSSPHPSPLTPHPSPLTGQHPADDAHHLAGGALPQRSRSPAGRGRQREPRQDAEGVPCIPEKG